MTPPADAENACASDIEEYLRRTPPECISGFQLRPVHSTRTSDAFRTCYRLGCACGCQTGAIVGSGPDATRDETGRVARFVGALAFHCAQCRTVTEIIDTQMCGCQAVLARQRGTGTAPQGRAAPRQAFSCPGCGGGVFQANVEFSWRGLALTRPESSPPPQDLFNEFFLDGACQRCGAVTQISELAEF